MTEQKRREITVRLMEGGSRDPEFRTMGIQAKDTQTGANIWIPVYGINRDGAPLEGRERAAHVAGLLLAAQGSAGRPSWDRSTADREVFTVFDA